MGLQCGLGTLRVLQRLLADATPLPPELIQTIALMVATVFRPEQLFLEDPYFYPITDAYRNPYVQDPCPMTRRGVGYPEWESTFGESGRVRGLPRCWGYLQ